MKFRGQNNPAARKYLTGDVAQQALCLTFCIEWRYGNRQKRRLDEIVRASEDAVDEEVGIIQDNFFLTLLVQLWHSLENVLVCEFCSLMVQFPESAVVVAHENGRDHALQQVGLIILSPVLRQFRDPFIGMNGAVQILCAILLGSCAAIERQRLVIVVDDVRAGNNLVHILQVFVEKDAVLHVKERLETEMLLFDNICGEPFIPKGLTVKKIPVAARDYRLLRHVYAPFVFIDGEAVSAVVLAGGHFTVREKRPVSHHLFISFRRNDIVRIAEGYDFTLCHVQTFIP